MSMKPGYRKLPAGTAQDRLEIFGHPAGGSLVINEDVQSTCIYVYITTYIGVLASVYIPNLLLL